MIMNTNTNMRMRARTTRPMAGLGFAVGVILVLMGLVLVPAAGAFGIAVTFLGLAFAAWHGAHVFARRGAPAEVERDDGRAARTEAFASTLRALDGLRKDGLLSEEEFQAKRAEILRERW